MIASSQRRHAHAMLRFAEEIMLLLLHNSNGRFVGVSDRAVGYALAGAVLMELSQEGRLDTDLHRLVLISAKPTGDRLLDPVLEEIAAADGTSHDARYWVEHVARRAKGIRDQALERLVQAGILERSGGRFLWVLRARRYPLVDGQAQREVKLRILDALLGDGIPDPRDVVIICLADACGIFHELLTPAELNRAFPRFEQVRKMDLIGQAVAAAVADLDRQTEERSSFLASRASAPQL